VYITKGEAKVRNKVNSPGHWPSTRLFRLTILAPDIVSAILSGKHPPELTACRLMDDTRLPLDWNEQRRRLGFCQLLRERKDQLSICLSL
jgi:hypothetical protein